MGNIYYINRTVPFNSLEKGSTFKLYNSSSQPMIVIRKTITGLKNGTLEGYYTVINLINHNIENYRFNLDKKVIELTQIDWEED